MSFINRVIKNINMGIVLNGGNKQSGIVKKEKKQEVQQPTIVTPISEVVLTEQEVEFILVKLRDASYKGHEFDIYARVYKKLVDQIKK